MEKVVVVVYRQDRDLERMRELQIQPWKLKSKDCDFVLVDKVLCIVWIFK